ncbi:uncharacterized protein BDV14DRAFT_208882 [Aspergillus stella-maris]|uniref:uncharacterized protein n=1 Tax=Aspergillus stella-maris TaxID=1810926 RepID=UPI003CCDC716
MQGDRDTATQAYPSEIPSTINMGRLTYSARKISGIKAGQVVSKDLKKRIPPSTGSKAAARDPTLEIDLTGKCLTDEGFAQFIDDLIECTTYRSPEHPLGLAKVTEFHLSGNNLTTFSLAQLGTVIANNPGDLRELDLSNNDFRIQSPEEKKIWKEFLDSFKNCYMLQRLDISDNPLGVKGLEILARVYVKSDLDYLDADAETIVRENHGIEQENDEEASLADETAALKISEKDKENDPRAGRSKKSPAKGAKVTKQNGSSSNSAPSRALALADLKRYACTRGLRAIPYFILSNIIMENSSAVHLSHMIMIQRGSAQLLIFLPPTKASAIPEFAHDSRSLLWQPNASFTNFSKRLLDATEAIVDSKAKADAQESSDFELVTGDEGEGDETSDEATKLKQKNKLALDFSRLTKRVRIECLKQEGVHASDIVSIALKMMVISRALLLDDDDRVVVSEVEEDVEDETSDDVAMLPHDPDTVPDASVPTVNIDQEVEHMMKEEKVENEMVTERSITESPVEVSPRPNYAGVFASDYVSGPFHPAAHLFDEEFPALQPPIHQEETQRPVEETNPSPEPTELLIESSPIAEPEANENGISSGPASSPGNRHGRKGTLRSNIAKKPRKTSWRFGLPFEIWRRIISDALGANGILDVEQQSRIMHYASDWDNVAYELTIKGAEEHQQIWKIVDTVGCFVYSPLP